MLKKIIVSVFALAIIAAAAAAYSVYAPNSFSEAAVIRIDEGMSAGMIGRALKSRGLIRSSLAFKWYVAYSGSAQKLVSGTHEIKAGSSISSIVAQLKSMDNSSRERTITAIEGWRLKELAAYLAKEGIASEESFMAAAKINDWSGKYPFLGDPKIRSLEGFLYPDTYNIFIDATPEDIIKKMLDEFDSKVTAQMRSDLRSRGRSLLEAVTLASIIEREISNKPEYDSDRRIVSGIFWSRLEIGMGLQSDATVNYATGKSMTRPTLKDLEIDSPYNTYKYRGLPPGPINSPSLASISAAIYPAETDYLYFLTDENGKAYFAATYDGHLKNIRLYLDN